MRGSLIEAAHTRQRLAAILAADAAGYSRLMAQDEQATIAALDAARETFRTAADFHDGRVIDTAGDSVLAVFRTAAGAVNAAIDIQAALEVQSAAKPPDCRLSPYASAAINAIPRASMTKRGLPAINRL